MERNMCVRVSAWSNSLNLFEKKKTGDVMECGSVETILADKQFYYKTTRAHPWAATWSGRCFNTSALWST